MSAAEIDVLVVGAGVAGLSASAELRAAGLSVVVAEALDRPGGRALTTRPPLLGGAAFDHGPRWLHAARDNPLADLARRCGEPVRVFARNEHVRVGDRPATAAELAGLAAARDRYEHAGRAMAASDGRRSLAAVADGLQQDRALAPWLPAVEAWESTIIDAAEPSEVGLHDWAANALDGEDLVFPDGLGDFVRRRLAPPAGEVAYGVSVTGVDWGGGGVVARTGRGDLRARAAVVTASTAALPRIAFAPALPDAVAAAVADLPLGLAIKLAFRWDAADAAGWQDDTTLFRAPSRRGEPMMVFNIRLNGQPHVGAWIGGARARELAAEPGAAEAAARATFADLLGSRAGRLAPEAVVTGWDRVESIGGAYSNARPGALRARATLAEPLADGRLVFAGEACHEGMAGTVAGAWLSGRQAAKSVLAALGGQTPSRSRAP